MRQRRASADCSSLLQKFAMIHCQYPQYRVQWTVCNSIEPSSTTVRNNLITHTLVLVFLLLLLFQKKVRCGVPKFQPHST